MAGRKTHKEDCMRLIGKECDNVHAWLDKYAAEFPPPIFLEYHRRFRHNKKALNKQFKVWGFYEIMAAKIHIVRDFDIYVLNKPMDLVEIEEIEDLYNTIVDNYCIYKGGI